MANILILTQFFPPETNAGARRVGAIADSLSRKNNVSILTPQPGYPTSTLFDQLTVKEFDRKFSGRIIRCKAFRPHHPALIVRALGEIGMSMRLIYKGLFMDVELVIISTPSIFLAPFAWLLARLKGVKFVYDLRDLTWCYVRETANPTRFNELASVVLEKLSFLILRHSDLIVCATPGIAQILCHMYKLCAEKIITIMNGVSDDLLAAGEQLSPAVDAARPIVTYIGLFGHNHGVEIFLDVAKQLPAVDFFLIGDGPDKEKIIRRLTEEGIENITVPGYVTSIEKLSSYYQQSTLLISHIKNVPVMKSTAIPAKIFEYMAFGKPIIYAGEGVAVDFLTNIGCAVTVPPDDMHAIVQAISNLLQDNKKMKIMGEKGRHYVNKYYRRNELMLQLGREFDKRFNLNCKGHQYASNPSDSTRNEAGLDKMIS